MPDSSCLSAQPSEAMVSKYPKNHRIDLGDVTPHNLKLLKKVNQVCRNKNKPQESNAMQHWHEDRTVKI